MKAINKSQYGAARSLLETLINNHPDSAFVSPAKLSIGDARYAEGSYKQAELEYRDFITFSRTGQRRLKAKENRLYAKKGKTLRWGFAVQGGEAAPTLLFFILSI